MTPAPAPAATARAGQVALLWRLGLLLFLVLAVLTPAPVRAGLLLLWGAAALAALLAGLSALAPADRGDSPPSPPAPLPPAGERGVAPTDRGVSSSAPASVASPAVGAVVSGGVVAWPLLALVGLIVYGGVAGPILALGNLALAGTLAAPVVGVSLAVLLPGHDPAAAARSWALAVGVALWSVLGTVAIAELAARTVGSIPALVPLVLALAAWSAVRRAVRLQGMGGRWPEALGTGVGLTAIVMTTTIGVAQLLLGFVVGLLIAEEADRLIPPPHPGLFAVLRAELVAVQQQLVFTAPLVLLALTLLPPR